MLQSSEHSSLWKLWEKSMNLKMLVFDQPSDKINPKNVQLTEHRCFLVDTKFDQKKTDASVFFKLIDRNVTIDMRMS